MIKIEIHNHIEVAESKTIISKIIPNKFLIRQVEKKIAEEILKNLLDNNIKASITYQ